MGGGNKSTRSAASNSDDGGFNTDASIEKLINKVCANFADQLECKINKQFVKLEDKLSEINNSMKSLNAKVESNSDAIACIEAKYDYVEQSLKKNALRFHGLAEAEGENINDIIITFINTKLKIPCNIRDIDYAFRLGRYDNSIVKPRTILVNFVQNIIRNEVFSAKKLLKNSQFTIFEDLTPTRYETLVAAKKKFGNGKVWSAGGKVYVWNDRENKKIVLNSKNDLYTTV